MPNLINFNIETLARLFRKFKRVTNFNWYLHFHSKQRYVLVVESKTTKLSAIFTLNTIISKEESVTVKRTWKLNDEFLDYIQSVGLREAEETYISIDVDTNAVSINKEQGLTTFEIYNHSDLSILATSKRVVNGIRDVNLSQLSDILKTVSTSPFDFKYLFIDSNYNSYSLVTDNYGLVSVIERNAPSTVPGVYGLNIEELYNLISDFKFRVTTKEEEEQSTYLFDVIDCYTPCFPLLDVDNGTLEFDYESKKVGKNIAYDDCFMYLGVSSYINTDPAWRLTDTINELQFQYKVELTPKFLTDLYKRLKETTDDAISFLSKPTEVRIGIRELAWLTRLAKKYGVLTCELTDNNIMKVITSDHISYVTLYSKRENDVSSIAN